ncbi:DUF5667 domain-containing protein [Micromonospora sonneratiae]|uniref:DUF5667 domain-containing protein n=1 Tax=Micromonospora sonneratiae TaxID=1184706 RepID=A0ABW3YFJ5_9ACTN
MNNTVFCRRRAERFAQLLDEANGGRRHHVRSNLDQDLAGLVALGHRIPAAHPPVEVDTDFRTGLRAMLVATAERDGIGVTATADPVADNPPKRSAQSRQPVRSLLQPTVGLRQSTARGSTRRRGAVLVGVAAGAIALSGMSAASENAVPGDALYGMKRSTERAQLALASSDLSRGQLFLEFARTRLSEAEAVRGDAEGFAAALNDMDAAIRQGVKLLTTSAVQRRDEAALDAIGVFLNGQRQQALEMLQGATLAERERAETSLALLDSVRKRADQLRSTLRCGVVPAYRTDVFGPVPQSCPTGRSLHNGQTTGGSSQDQRPGGHTESSPVPAPGHSQRGGQPGVPDVPPPTPAVHDPSKLTEPIVGRPAD